MRRYLPELIALPLLPLLLAQGRRTRRLTPRLPEAGGADGGLAGAHSERAPLRLLAIGESPVAGVGVQRHDEAITGQLAQALAARLRRPVIWRACGRNGATVSEAQQQLLPQVPAQAVDLLLVAFGVNDSTAFHSVVRWRRDLLALLQALERRCQPRLLLLSGVPRLDGFPALPQPLRWVLGQKARALDAAARQLALERPRTCHVPLPLDGGDRSLMAIDGYHPSAAGCTVWAAALAAAVQRSANFDDDEENSR